MNYELIAEDQNLPLLTQIFLNRGFQQQDIQHYLQTTDDDILPPELLDNIEQAADILLNQINTNDKMCFIIDSDCDGFTSSAVLMNYIYRINPEYVVHNVKYLLHEGKQHGIELKKIPTNINLLVCADSASNDYEQHKTLYDMGITVLVIDHHQAPYVSEYACVVNNQLCDYPNKSLSGVGVVYKLCQILDKKLNVHYADDFLDLVALGEVADVMDLRPYETRRLIEKGIAQITNPFFKGMCEKNAFSLGDEITPTGIAFYIAPYVNAINRVGTQEEKQLLFEAMLEFKGNKKIPSTKRGHVFGEMETIAEQACRVCGNVKNHQTKARDHGLEVAEQIIKENDLLDKKILIICLPPEARCDTNLTGLIANVLMDKYQRPTLLLNQAEQDNEICWMGSGRGYAKSALKDFQKFLKKIGIYNWGGYAVGHPNAFGFMIPNKFLNLFIDKIEKTLKDFNFSPIYKVDRIYKNIEQQDYEELKEVSLLSKLWGQGIEEPQIAFENITPLEVKLMSPEKNPTLKIVLSSGLNCIKFKSSQEEYENLLAPEFGKITLNIIGRCHKNEWNGNVTPQIIIEDYEISDIQKYYF